MFSGLRREIERLKSPKIFAANFASFIIPRLVSSITFIIATNYFLKINTHENLATVLLYFTILAYQSLLDLGLGYGIFYGLSSGDLIDRKKNFQTGFRCFVWFALILLCVGGLGSPILSEFFFGDSTHFQNFLIVTGFFSLGLINVFFENVLRSFNKLVVINASNFMLEMVKVVLLFVFAKYWISVSVFLFILLVAQVIKTGIIVSSLRKTDYNYSFNEYFKFRTERTELLKLFSYSYPVFGQLLCGLLVHNSDRIIASKIINQASFAEYVLISDLCIKLWFVYWAISGTFLPIITSSSGNQRIRLVILSLVAFIVVSVLFYVPIMVYPGIVGFIYPELNIDNIRQLIIYFSILSMSYGFFCFIDMISKAIGRTDKVFYSYLLSGIIYATSLTIFWGVLTMELIAQLYSLYFIVLLLFSSIFLIDFNRAFKMGVDWIRLRNQ